MKQVNISISFEDDKLKALNRYLKKKGISVADEMKSALDKLYEKYVPAAVRAFIDDDDTADVEKPKRTVKDKKEAAPIEQPGDIGGT